MSLTIEVRNTDGSATSTVTSVGQVLNLEVLAVITSSSNQPTESGLQDVQGSFLSTAEGGSSVGGDLAAANVTPFRAAGAFAGTVQDLNGDGHLDVGSNNPALTQDYFFARAGSIQTSSTGTISGSTLTYEIATLTYTVTSLAKGGETSINFQPFVNPGGLTADWAENSEAVNSSDGTFQAGSAYTVTDPSLIVAPTAVNDTAIVALNTPTDIHELANDTVVQPLNLASVTVTQAAAHGSTALQSDGSILYTPATGYTGADSFMYTVKDTDGRLSNAATVSITVKAAPAPTASFVQSSTFIDQPVSVNVLSHDSTTAPATLVASSVTVTSPPAHGTAVAQTDGTILYTPSTGYVGTDGFSYTVSDSNGETSSASTVAVNVQTPVAPTANNDTFNVIAGTPTSLNVQANDVLGSITTGVTVHLASTPLHGTAVVQSDGTVLYTPNAGYTGNDSFSYVLLDSIDDASAVADVALTIGAALPPTATAVVAPVLSGTTGSINVLANVTGEAPIVPSSVTIVTGPLDGTATVNSSTGAVSYTPIAGFIGTDTFTFTAADTNGQTTAASTVSVNVGTSISNAKGAAHSIQFTDAGGGLETVSLNVGTAEVFFSGTGSLTVAKNGRATVAGSSLELGSIQLTGTTRASSLSVKGSGKTAVTLGGITDASPLGSVSAAGASVSGTINLNSSSSVVLGNISAATITIGNGTPGRTSLTAGTVTDSSLTSAVPITLLKAASWTTTGSDTITAPSIGSLQIAGAFNPGLTLTAPASRVPVLSSARITGAVSGGAWNVSGNVGTVLAGSVWSAWGGAFKNINSFTIKAGGLSSDLSAGTIGLLSVGGNVSGDLTATGAVQTIRINGAVNGSSMGFATTLGSLIISGAVSDATIASGGNIRSISTGAMTGTSIEVATGTLDITGSTFAVSDAGLTLPTATAASVGTGTLSSIRTAGFGSSTVLAGTIGSASLGTITTDNSGTTFGIGMKKLSTFAGVFASGTLHLNHATLANQAVLTAYEEQQGVTLGDFSILLLT